MANMTYVVAVSGGVDSVVLLDMLVRKKLPHYLLSPSDYQLIVAHFDHGIRAESAEDAEFVKKLAEEYGLHYETKHEELGANASEELARDRRYEFLRSIANKYHATLVTAHHGDDMIETIAINLTRGTGWRGLAVLDSTDILRPLLAMSKKDIIDYAKASHLAWHEDATNKDMKYLRNDLRRKLEGFEEESKELLRLYRNRQVALRRMIDTEIDAFTAKPYPRYFFANVPRRVAIEILRSILIKEIGVSPVRPQLERMVLAIKTYQLGKVFAINATATLKFSQTHFVVQKRGEVVS